MNILAINSSPRTGNQSKTELMLDHLVKGMRDAGAKVEVINLRDKKIKNCIGCFTCWTKNPGRCRLEDDMTKEIFPKWLKADLAVYATPLYIHTMNAAMSTFRERTLPALQPFFEKDANGKTHHPPRYKTPPVVWLSVCGFPDQSEFAPLSDFLNRTYRKGTIVAEIYRTASEAIINPLLEEKIADVLDATEQAGRELVEAMRVSPETMARITQPLMDTELFGRMGNIFWKTCIAEGVTPKQFQKKGIIPRPESIEDFMLLFPYGLNAKAAGDRTVTLQINFSGAVSDSCYFSIEGGAVEAKRGACPNPDITIDTPFDLWIDIMTRKADGQQMFMEQQYTVAGDLMLMLQLFKREG